MCDTWLLYNKAETLEVNNDTCKAPRLCRYVYHTFTSISSVGEETIFSYYRSVSKSKFYDSRRCKTLTPKRVCSSEPFYELRSSLLAGPASHSVY